MTWDWEACAAADGHGHDEIYRAGLRRERTVRLLPLIFAGVGKADDALRAQATGFRGRSGGG